MDAPTDGQPARFAVGIGASAGGIEALLRVVANLPADLEAAVLIVLHVSAGGPSLLAEILARRSTLPVAEARDGEPLRAGRVLVAPPDRHLVVANGRVRLERGPKENGVRPAVDPMLRSLAAGYGSHSIAVILSGAMGDGAGGARVVASAGGRVVVQDPDDAVVMSMPERAIAAVGELATVIPANEVGATLAELTREAPIVMEGAGMIDPEPPLQGGLTRPEGPPTGFTCPECHGALWTVPEGDGFRYRCRIGHAYSEEALVGAQGDKIEAALWTALEVLEERAELLGRLAERHEERFPGRASRLRGAHEDARFRAQLIREALAATSHTPDALAIDGEDLPT